jgi:hypothetical protein
MKRFVRGIREPVVLGVFVVLSISLAEAHEWMYAILYPAFALWLGWPYLTSWRRSQRAD